MRAGRLDIMIVIQRATVTQSPSGEPQESWTTLSQRWAMLEPITGEERFATEQLVARAQVAFTIRWSSVVDDVTPRDRIICPAAALASSPSQPAKNTIYDIITVQPIGRNEGLKIFAAVRQDEMS